MTRHANTDLIDVLDRLLDKGILIESWTHIRLGAPWTNFVEPAQLALEAAEIYLGYGARSRKRPLEIFHPFPYSQRDLWTK